MKLAIPFGDGEYRHLTISPKADALRFSLRTRDPATAKIRHASVVGYLETVWKGLRATEPETGMQKFYSSRAAPAAPHVKRRGFARHGLVCAQSAAEARRRAAALTWNGQIVIPSGAIITARPRYL